MKKHFIFYIGIQTVLTAFLLLFCLSFLKNNSASEMHTVQNLAGSLIGDFPETEPVFMQALQNSSQERKAEGALILSNYGFDESDFYLKNSFYRQSISACLLITFLFFILFLVSGLCSYSAIKQKQKTEKEMLQTMLERCLSDDYDFLRDFQKTPPMKQDELSDTFLKLAKKLSLKSEILAQERDHTKTLVTDISHQLKTPLSALKTCFFVYLEADTPEEKEEFGRRCQFQLEKLENLTASLIHISRLENAMILLRPAPVSLTQILIDAVNAVYEKAQSKEIILDIGDFEDITLSLDLKWTAEALFNILDNAVKYSETGSQILIRVQPLYSFVRLEIEDQGIGIPRGEYNNIFKRFYRVQNETVQKAEGSGVGLYLSRKILEEQGGTLSVKAAREQGSIFVVQLPLSSRIP
mgnify:CR=1 FL=1